MANHNKTGPELEKYRTSKRLRKLKSPSKGLVKRREERAKKAKELKEAAELAALQASVPAGTIAQ